MALHKVTVSSTHYVLVREYRWNILKQEHYWAVKENLSRQWDTAARAESYSNLIRRNYDVTNP